MAYDPMEGFKVGQEIGKSKKSALGRTSDYMSDLTTQRDKGGIGLDKVLQAAMLKNALSKPLQDSQIAVNEARADRLSNTETNLSPGQQIQKNKATQNLFEIIERNKVKKQALSKAISSLGSLPTGRIGSMKVWAMKNFDPENPKMEDWQNVKSVLTDAQLMNVAKTKGAISDREMELFSQAAANDDLISVSRMRPVLSRLSDFMQAEENAAIGSYKQSYNEDPMEFLGGTSNNSNSDDPGGLFS